MKCALVTPKKKQLVPGLTHKMLQFFLLLTRQRSREVGWFWGSTGLLPSLCQLLGAVLGLKVKEPSLPGAPVSNALIK